MGTPEFAVTSLNALVNAGCTIVAVITAPDKPAGRGMALQQSAVKQYALSKGLNILQPEKLKNPGFITELKKLNADLQIVVAFRMLPEVVWGMPPMGTINLHGSLLPQYRGAAPINWAIINGEKETGVTTFLLQQQIDTGNILMQERFPITESDNAGTLHDKMKEIGAAVLLQTVQEMANGTLQSKPQNIADEQQLKHAPKIFTETCKIDFNKPVEEVFNLIRGLSPYPAAFTLFNNKKLKIYSADKNLTPPQIAPGHWQTDKKNYLQFACSNGSIHVLELQLEGKKKMKIDEFLRGYRFE
ncbi:MAG: methionyl-tRNA formyltransferase [Bacteroidetes bacterium]|mgnify:CR=1 FL=1|nr:methionyl-tRNA formyltransferase [Bacteroidota bacterium]MBS1924544.1 methionyl-tRNA formyltransferase [Bacteroidota bacterium]MCC6691994.1 methionyl-tRNA formyltransferase [Chitinophagaceae bacterium]